MDENENPPPSGEEEGGSEPVLTPREAAWPAVKVALEQQADDLRGKITRNAQLIEMVNADVARDTETLNNIETFLGASEP